MGQFSYLVLAIVVLTLALYWELSGVMAALLLLVGVYFFILHERIFTRRKKDIAENDDTQITVQEVQQIYAHELAYRIEINTRMRKIVTWSMLVVCVVSIIVTFASYHINHLER